MPLIQIYTPSNLLDRDVKQTLVKQLTGIYTSFGLPAFYVNIFFHEVPPDDFYIGGEPASASNDTKADVVQASHFIRFTFVHLAREFPDQQVEEWFMSRVDGIVKPLFEPKGWHWEYHIMVHERRLWKVDSIAPPQAKSEAEVLWAKEGRASEWRKE